MSERIAVPSISSLLLLVLIVVSPPRPTVARAPGGLDDVAIGGRHTINAVLGDASYVARYGTVPSPGTDPDDRIRTHLEFVHALLSRRDVSELPAERRNARRRHLAALRDYVDAGLFPRNDRVPGESRPCFIDRRGRICAVGYLIEQSAGRGLAERLDAAYETEYLWRMQDPELARWVAASGFTLLELCMVQPAYPPSFEVEIVLDSERAPATAHITGSVIDEDCSGIRHVELDFGDGETWASGEIEAYVPVLDLDLHHTFTCPGTHTITATAEAWWCKDSTAREEWRLTLVPPSVELEVSREPGGPPYLVYLYTASDIRLPYLSDAAVNWDDSGEPEDAGWFVEGETFRTLTHEYASGGDREIVVTHRYEGLACSFDELTSMIVPLDSSPTRPVTWARIKGLYAATSR